MKNIKIFIYCLFCVPGSVLASENCATIRHLPKHDLTLQEVINLGLCRNPRTASAYSSLQSARFTKNAAHSYYLPTVTGSVDGNRNHTEHDDWNYSASLSASYLIFDFGKRESDFAESLAIYRAAGFDYDETIQNFIFSIIGAYYELLTADANVKSAQSALTVAQTAKDTADKKYKSGAVAKADVYKADTTLASSKLSLERAKNNREITKGNLLNTISFPASEEIKIKDMPASFGSDTELENIEELISIARKKRPDLLKANAQTSAAWHRKNSAFLKNLPSFSVHGTANLNDKTMDGMFEHMSTKVNGSVGVSVSMPIFTGFSNIYKARSAKSDYESIKYSQESLTDDAMLDVFSAYQNYKTAKTILDQSETLLKSATETERVTSGMYKVGRATMLDWLTAQSELADAQKQNNAAKYDLFIKRASVALAIGDIKSGLKDNK
ncbi:MAG: TolC family protein [Alphaproteobacteria bacterium]|nr:TolC family protein [Alphaproteobacteria bacterium]